jgi:hypothetical protein
MVGVQYPHLLYASVVAESTRDANGDYVPSEAEESEEGLECRAVSSTGNGYITGADGSHIDYSWIVYMPQSTPVLQVGTQVRIERPDDTDVVDTVKRFSRGQMNCRAWL